MLLLDWFWGGVPLHAAEGTPQNFPDIPTPFVDKDNQITTPWRYLLMNLWERTGGTQGGGGMLSAGNILMHGSALVIPAGFLLCDGSTYRKATYPRLAAVVGAQWGTASADEFRVPNFQNLFPIGASASRPINATGGAGVIAIGRSNLPDVAFTVTDSGHTHAKTETPHNHGVNDDGHVHALGRVAANNATAGSAAGSVPGNTASATTGITLDPAVTGLTIAPATTGITVRSGGTGETIPSLPPYRGVPFIIKT